MDSQIYGCPFATKQLINVYNVNPNVCVKMKIGMQTIQLKISANVMEDNV